MKELVFILLFLIPVFPQETKETLYLKGMLACLGKELESFAKFSDRDLRNVFVAYEFDLTRELPTQLGETRIQYLNDYELAEKYKTLPKTERERGIPLIKIFPLSDRGV